MRFLIGLVVAAALAACGVRPGALDNAGPRAPAPMYGLIQASGTEPF